MLGRLEDAALMVVLQIRTWRSLLAWVEALLLAVWEFKTDKA